MTNSKITTGSNDRPKHETIAQTGEGIPDDSSTPVAADEDEVERLRRKLKGDARQELLQEVEEDIELPQKGSA